MRQTIYAVILVLFGLAPASADIRIEGSPGGEVDSFLRFFAQVRHSGERVVIDGPCFSACTLILSAVPRNRICVTARAVLGFHAAKYVDEYGEEYPAPEATRVMNAAYPSTVRGWIKKHGGLKRVPIFLSGHDLAAMYPRCI